MSSLNFKEGTVILNAVKNLELTRSIDPQNRM